MADEHQFENLQCAVGHTLKADQPLQEAQDPAIVAAPSHHRRIPALARTLDRLYDNLHLKRNLVKAFSCVFSIENGTSALYLFNYFERKYAVAGSIVDFVRRAAGGVNIGIADATPLHCHCSHEQNAQDSWGQLLLVSATVTSL